MDGKTRPTHRFHAVCHKPMETLDEQQEAEHDDEGDVKVIPEYRERQQRFGYEHPSLVVQPLRKCGISGSSRH